jgi:hypothetical protein
MWWRKNTPPCRESNRSRPGLKDCIYNKLWFDSMTVLRIVAYRSAAKERPRNKQ